MRSIITIAISLALMGTTALASEVKLRSSIVVEDKYITLSDLFDYQVKKGLLQLLMHPRPANDPPSMPSGCIELPGHIKFVGAH